MSVSFSELNSQEASDAAPDDSLPTFFSSALGAFERAAQAAGGAVDRHYLIGGHLIRLRFAGTALVPLITPALEHLFVKSEETASLTICMGDSASTGIQMPFPPVKVANYMARGGIWSCQSQRCNLISQTTDSVFNILDKAEGVALYWVEDALQLPQHETGSPLLKMLHWWMADHGCQLVHAGAVGTAEGGVLLAGKGGSGKSTTALACLSSQLLYAGDDYCLLANNPSPYAYSLYNSGKVRAKDIERFPLLQPALAQATRLDTGKALCFIYEHLPHKIALGFSIRAILIPQVSGGADTRVNKVSPATAYLALTPSTVYQLPGVERGAFHYLSKFIKQVPCYSLQLGTELSQIPETILSLLDEG